ncbi:MAG TPA: inositol monophosphatase family protein [Candidatus Omnitrophota bacterium]|jgi:myo-inositol-1(or 4)-monophosphatase|nr:inositol monophosphatase family protein [Candidatus Omnitrophota bacterium]HSA30596.1 inositol monophosphatase family protein [Candidatus Omnitrophota bacterium]
MDSAEKYLKLMFDVVRQAGRVSLEMIEESKASLKADDSVVTAADHAVSLIVRERLDEYVRSGQHILIDEEDPKRLEYRDQSLLEKVPFIWVLDPVDGTRLYANRIPLYGVSIGLLKDLKPWLGVVYFPMLKELFYCDGTRSFFLTGAFTPEQKRQEIETVDAEISSKSLFMLSDHFFKDHDWAYTDCRFLVSACAVVNLCWPAIGRACGSLDRSNIWDFGGAWPIARSAGLELRHFETGKVFDRLDISAFEPQEGSWRFAQYHILSSERNFELLRRYMRKKS